MSNYELYGFGSSDCSDITTFSPQGDFFISIEFDIRKKGMEGFMTYYFFLATKEGVASQKHSDELAFIEIVNEYSFDFVKKYLQEKVEQKIEELGDQELFHYLNSNFNFVDD